MKAGEIDKKPGDRENSAKNGSLPAKPGELAGLGYVTGSNVYSAVQKLSTRVLMTKKEFVGSMPVYIVVCYPQSKQLTRSSIIIGWFSKYPVSSEINHPRYFLHSPHPLPLFKSRVTSLKGIEKLRQIKKLSRPLLYNDQFCSA